MDAETAKALTDAMNRLATALEGLRNGGGVPGIHVYHHDVQPTAFVGFGTTRNPYYVTAPAAAGGH